MVDKEANLIRLALSVGLIEVLRAYQALEIDSPPDTAEMWGDNTRPSIDMICAKLVRYSSNMYAVAYAYPETVLESNMDYDLRQYLMFLHAFGEHYGVNLMDLVQPVKT